ncbi:MAG: hypothetical protein AAGG01_18915 [Planctomycetota bacterium]
MRISTALALLCLAVLAPTARLAAEPLAEPLVGAGQPQAAPGALAQVRITGQVNAVAEGAEVGSQPFGHLVEIEVDASTTRAGAAPASMVLHMHVAAGTTGESLIELAGERLRALEIAVTVTGVGDGSKGASLWISRATRVHLRLGGGLAGEISCAEGPPASIQILPATAIPGPATAFMSASTAIVMKDRRPIRGRASFDATLVDLKNTAETATALWTAASEGSEDSVGWVSERPGSDRWRPVKMANGAAITGVSVRLGGRADWGLVVEL